VATARDGSLCEKAIFHKLTGSNAVRGSGQVQPEIVDRRNAFSTAEQRTRFRLRNDEISLDEVERIGK
jgi:hypothetical protein